MFIFDSRTIGSLHNHGKLTISFGFCFCSQPGKLFLACFSRNLFLIADFLAETHEKDV
jgi:hypothetical protein